MANNYTGWGIAGLIAAILTAVGIAVVADKPKQMDAVKPCESCGSMQKYLQG